MNKVIVNFAIVSCFALGATLVHAGNGNAATKVVNYYEAYDPHGAVQTGPGGVQGVMHPKHPIQMESEEGVASPNAPTPPIKEMNHPGGHRSVDGA